MSCRIEVGSIRKGSSSEGERKCLYARVQKLDCERIISDRALLPRQLIQAKRCHNAMSHARRLFRSQERTDLNQLHYWRRSAFVWLKATLLSPAARFAGTSHTSEPPELGAIAKK